MLLYIWLFYNILMYFVFSEDQILCIALCFFELFKGISLWASKSKFRSLLPSLFLTILTFSPRILSLNLNL